MMWGKIILLGLELLNRLFGYFQEQKWIQEGEDRAIARASAEIMRKSNYAKQALEEFASKPDAAVDDFLRGLGGDGGDSK
jgi:hypothetical protein